jgi:valyl-tRNA synthetase
MDTYNFVVANKYLVDFVWKDYCNYYLELAKPLINDDLTKQETLFFIKTIFKNILILLHPHAPFASESLYLEMFKDKTSIMLEC